MSTQIALPIDMPSNLNKDHSRPNNIHKDHFTHTSSIAKCGVLLQKLSHNHSDHFSLEDIKSGRSITPEALAYLVRFHPVQFIILDCRSFIKYNTSHIKDAINVSCCNGTVRKRISDGKLRISEIVMGGSEAKEKIKVAEEINSLFIVYDDGAYDVCNKKAVDSINILTTKLISENRDVCNLEGGMESFKSQYDFLCETSLQNDHKPLLYSPTSPYIDAAIDSTQASQILPFLYLGNERDATDENILLSLGITHILNITHGIPLLESAGGKALTCMRIPANDRSNQNLKQYFVDAIGFIEQARENSGKLLLHCQAGVSRSPTVTIAYIMATMKKTMMEAFDFVKEKRNIISPNLNFMGQLLEFQEYLQSAE